LVRIHVDPSFQTLSKAGTRIVISREPMADTDAGGNFLRIGPFCTKPWGRIKRHQDNKAKFHNLLFSMDFCSFRRFSLSTHFRGVMQPGTKGADLQEYRVQI